MRTPKLLLLFLSFILFSVSQARADDVSYSYMSGGNTFTFELPQMPVIAMGNSTPNVMFTITGVAFSETGGTPMTGTGVVDFFSSAGMLGGFDLWNGNVTTPDFFIDAFGVPGDTFPFTMPGQQLYTGGENAPTLLSSGGPFSFLDLSTCDNDTTGTNCPANGVIPPTGILDIKSVPTPTPESSTFLLLAIGLALGMVSTLLRKN